MPPADRGKLTNVLLRLLCLQAFLQNESDASVRLSICYYGTIDPSVFYDASAEYLVDSVTYVRFAKYRFPHARAPFMVIHARRNLHFLYGPMAELYKDCGVDTDFRLV